MLPIGARLIIFAAISTLVAALTTPVSADAATTLYVDSNNNACSDQGPGTGAQPFCSIIQGAKVVLAGQTLQVASGTYGGPVNVTHSGTSGAPITITAAPGATPTVTGSGAGFQISSQSYVVINGFTITGTTGNGISVSGGSNITISRNTVTKAGQRASGKIAAGIKLAGTTDSLVSQNVSNDNSDHGFFLAANTTRITVSNNRATLNANGYQRNANGIDVIGPANSIINNVTYENEDSGIQFYTGGDNNLAAGNVSYNNGDHGIDDLNVTGGRLIGNTIYRNCTTGINVEGASGNYTIANNIAFDNAVYPAYKGISCSRRAGNIGVWDSAPNGTVANHNQVWLTKSGKMYVWAGNTYNTLPSLQSATGQENRGIYADPAFVSPGTWNLQLLAGSPAIDSANSGVSGQQTIDVLGNPRVDDPGVANTGAGPRAYDDRGAYERQAGPPPPVPPTAALSLTPSSGTAPLNLTADASGSTPGDNPISSYRFDFGDGTTVGPQSSPSAAHTFANPGTYTVTVTVTDTAGNAGVSSRSATALPSHTPPSPSLTLTPSSGTAPLNVTADASASTPGDSPISSYRFDFGDGTIVGPQAGSTATHVYGSAGSFTVTVTVTDTAGQTGSTSKGVTVSGGGGTELVGNPGFETGTTGWKAIPTGSATLSTVSGGHSGSFAGELQNVTTGAISCTLNDSPNWALTTQSGTLTASAWVRASTAGQTIKLKLTEYVGSTNVGSASATLTLGTAWQLISVPYTVTSPGSTVDFLLYTSSNPPGQCFQADDLSLLRNATLTAGSTANAVR
ncbi:PKD domain-containing protein [Nonomuraea sediminis]|uniref:PKD domain-containing protein n=1 Tax=Nonomuraea sediminis TaxID=2835864 RepID=UPI001BDDB94C|nr:PKD domain-containing protein [Nonomuraea sediminis]